MLENTVDWIRGHRIHTRMIFVGIFVVLGLNAVSCSRSVAQTSKQFNFGLNKHSAEPLGYVVDAFISDDNDHSLAVLTWNDSASTSHERMTTILSLDKQTEGDRTHYYLTSGILIKTKGENTIVSISPFKPYSFYGYSDSNTKFLAYNGYIDRPYSDPEYSKSWLRFEVTPDPNPERVEKVKSEVIPLLERQPYAEQLLCCIRPSSSEDTGNKCVELSQIIYKYRLESTPLSSMQLKTLSCFLELNEIRPSDIWFVRISPGRDGQYSAEIYFLPETTKGRFRKGKVTGYDSSFSIIRFHNIPGPHQEERKERYFWDYIQIADEENSSLEKPKVPAQDTFLPFSSPKDFTDQEIVEIVDFIRSKPKVKEVPSSSAETVKSNAESESSNIVDYLQSTKSGAEPFKTESIRVPMDYDIDQPILSIERKESIIEVTLGVREGFLSGRGYSLKIRKTDQEYELIGVSYWVS